MSVTRSSTDPQEEAEQQEKPQMRSSRRSTDSLTLQDIAKLAGVAPITVSRVLNRPDLVTPETIKSVQKVIDRTGYVPNLLAGGLASRRSGLIAAMVPSLRNMMFVQVVERLNDIFNAAGYKLLLGLTGYPQRENELMATFLSRRPEAVLLTGVNHSPETRQRLLAAKIPVVEIWDYTPTPIDMLVGFSHEKIGRAVARLFHKKGFRSVCMVMAKDRRALLRFRAFKKELEHLGVHDVVTQMTRTPGTFRLGREALARILDRGQLPDAIFCSSDSLAHGVMTEAQSRGMKIPDDLAVIGFGDLDFSGSTFPALSTVSIKHREIGSLAAEAILARLNNQPIPERVIDIGFEIIERGST